MSDINKVWISGTVVSEPIHTQLGNRGTSSAHFYLKIEEKFKDRNNKDTYHNNHIRVEGLGRASSKIMETVKKDSRVCVEGYLRQDRIGSRDDVRVRLFAVYPDDSNESRAYSLGLLKALEILESSLDSDAAVEEISAILKRGRQGENGK